MGDSAFKDCDALTGVTLPSTVRSIGTYCFADGALFAEIYIGKNVSYLGTGIFGSVSPTIYYEGTEADWNRIETTRQGWDAYIGTYEIVYGATAESGT